ncbi:MAG: hypothetical protein AAFX09_03140 [Pseudomonadota bacterium]
MTAANPGDPTHILTVAPVRDSYALAEQIDAFLALFFEQCADESLQARRTGPMTYVISAEGASGPALESVRLGIAAALFDEDDGSVTLRAALQGDWVPQDALDLEADDLGLGEPGHLEPGEPGGMSKLLGDTLDLSDPDLPLEIEPAFGPPSTRQPKPEPHFDPVSAGDADPVAEFLTGMDEIASDLEGRIGAATARLEDVSERLSLQADTLAAESRRVLELLVQAAESVRGAARTADIEADARDAA